MTTTTPTIEIAPGETYRTIREQLPYGGDWGLVRDGEEWLLWLDIAPDGSVTLNDHNSSIALAPDENLYAIAEKWLADVS